MVENQCCLIYWVKPYLTFSTVYLSFSMFDIKTSLFLILYGGTSNARPTKGPITTVRVFETEIH